MADQVLVPGWLHDLTPPEALEGVCPRQNHYDGYEDSLDLMTSLELETDSHFPLGQGPLSDDVSLSAAQPDHQQPEVQVNLSDEAETMTSNLVLMTPILLCNGTTLSFALTSSASGGVPSSLNTMTLSLPHTTAPWTTRQPTGACQRSSSRKRRRAGECNKK